MRFHCSSDVVKYQTFRRIVLVVKWLVDVLASQKPDLAHEYSMVQAIYPLHVRQFPIVQAQEPFHRLCLVVHIGVATRCWNLPVPAIEVLGEKEPYRFSNRWRPAMFLHLALLYSDYDQIIADIHVLDQRLRLHCYSIRGIQ